MSNFVSRLFGRRALIAVSLLAIVALLAVGVFNVQVKGPGGDNGGLLSVSAGQRTLVIGAVDSVAAAGTVDYTCDGVADNVQFQAALNALPAGGGRISVLAGTYVFAAGTSVTRAIDSVTISGVGRATYFTGDGVTALFVAGGNNWKFEDLRTDASGINLGATTGWQMTNVLINATYYAYRTANNSEFGTITTSGKLTAGANEVEGSNFDINGGTVDSITSLTGANDLDIGAFELRAQTFESDVATGTAPFTIASTTTSTNLSADLVDGYQMARSATIVVAAFDATAKEKAQADYVTGATDADTVIETALAAAAASGRGSVTLIGDTFTGSDDIDAVSNVDVEGNGANIVIATTNIVNGLTFASTTNTHWKNFTIRRTGAVASLGFAVVAFSGTTDELTVVEDVVAYNDTTSLASGGAAWGTTDTAHPTIRSVRGYSAQTPHSQAFTISGSWLSAGNVSSSYPTIIDSYMESRGTGSGSNNGFDIEGANPTGENTTKTQPLIINSIGVGSPVTGGGISSSHGISLKWGTGAHVINSIGYSGASNLSAGISIEGQATPIIENSTGIGRGTETGAFFYGIIVQEGAKPTLNNVTGLAEPYDYRSMSLYIEERGSPVINGGYFSFIEHQKIFSYDDANNGRFRPFASNPYQLITLSVYVNVAYPGETIDIGTSIGGNEVANNVSIAGAQFLHPTIVQVQVAADGYLYITPSVAINDDDVQIYYTVMKNYTNSYGLFVQSSASYTGYFLIDGATFYGGGAPYLLAGGSAGALSSTYGKITNSRFNWLASKSYGDISSSDWTALENNIFNNANLTGGYPSMIPNHGNKFLGYLAPGERAIARVPALTAGVASTIAFAYHNPYANDVAVERIEMVAGGGNAGSHLDIGIADDAAGTNRGTEFFNNLTLDATAFYSSQIAAGGGTQTVYVTLQDSASATDGWVAAQILDADAPGAAGWAYIYLIGLP